jgi:hypothetical protein
MWPMKLWRVWQKLYWTFRYTKDHEKFRRQCTEPFDDLRNYEKFGRNYAKPVVELGSYEEFWGKKQWAYR